MPQIAGPFQQLYATLVIAVLLFKQPYADVCLCNPCFCLGNLKALLRAVQFHQHIPFFDPLTFFDMHRHDLAYALRRHHGRNFGLYCA